MVQPASLLVDEIRDLGAWLLFSDYCYDDDDDDHYYIAFMRFSEETKYNSEKQLT